MIYAHACFGPGVFLRPEIPPIGSSITIEEAREIAADLLAAASKADARRQRYRDAAAKRRTKAKVPA